MKIIFITREGYNLSGARVRCYNFARALRKYGISAEVFSFADNLGAKYGEKEFEMSFFEKIGYNIKALNVLLKKEKGSVFFIQRLNYHALAPFLVSLLRGNRIIFDCDDWNIRENPQCYLGFYPSSKMEFLTRKIAKYSKTCVTASAFLKDYISKFNDKVYHIPTGVDTGLFKPDNKNNSNSKITFSWIGTMYHKEMYENIRFILDCFSVLADKYNNIYLNLAGEGKYFQETNNYADSFRCRDRIKIDSWIPPDEISRHLSNTDIGLLPLIQDTKFNRAKSPTKLFEYMAMAKPTVSSNIGEAGRVIHDAINGFLAKDKEEFMVKMDKLITDPVLRVQMGILARRSVEENYSLSVLGRQLYEIIRTV